METIHVNISGELKMDSKTGEWVGPSTCGSKNVVCVDNLVLQDLGTAVGTRVNCKVCIMKNPELFSHDIVEQASTKQKATMDMAYMGRRMNHKDKVSYTFRDEGNGEELWFSKNRVNAKVGAVYSVPVEPKEDGSRGWWFGDAVYKETLGEYTGHSTTVAEWEALDFAAQTRKIALSRAVSEKQDELTKMLQPIITMLGNTKTSNERAALLGTIMTKLTY